MCELLESVLKGAKKAGADVKIIYLNNLIIIHEPGYYSENLKKDAPIVGKNMVKLTTLLKKHSLSWYR